MEPQALPAETPEELEARKQRAWWNRHGWKVPLVMLFIASALVTSLVAVVNAALLVTNYLWG